MDENLNDLNIDDLLQKMNSPEMSDTIKNLLGSISSDETSDDFSSLFSALSTSFSSSKLDLLAALKPYVNKKRQKKIEQCGKFVSMINAFSLINNLTKDSDE